MARQADGSCTVQFGETMVLCTATAQDHPTHLPFFPLTIEYRERTYAAGKIPGGFIKREGRPSDKEILSARLIDRPLRPLFPDGFANETQIFVYVISADQENDADVMALTGASLALNMSRIPFTEPGGGGAHRAHPGAVGAQPHLPAAGVLATWTSIVAGTEDAIMMVEGGALEVPEEEIAEGLHGRPRGDQGADRDPEARSWPAMDAARRPWRGRPRRWTRPSAPRVESSAGDRVREALTVAGKHERAGALDAVKTEIAEALAEEFPESGKDVGSVVKDLEKREMREMILSTGKRSDGRGTDEVRPISIDVGVLPRAHGSALFTRGQTQALGVTTLGTQGDEQAYDTVDFATQQKKSFMLHYNFPPFSTGEVKPMRGTSRREIGHGALAERALEAMLPPFDEFPYTVRVVSDVLESNGSSSMATVCAGSLSLMDAGVPMRAAVAGVAMGLIKEGDRVAVLTDILGSEDALGDMDFKVAGTREGVTSIQMDIKIKGLTLELMRRRCSGPTARGMHILDEMDKVLPRPRGAVGVRAAHHHHQGGPGQDRRDHRAQGQDDPRHPGGHGRHDQHRRRRHDHHRVGERRGRRARPADHRRDDRGGRGGPHLRGPGQEHHDLRRVRGDHARHRGAAAHQRAQAGRVEKTEDVVKKGDVVQVKLLSIDEKGRLRLRRKAALAELAGRRRQRQRGDRCPGARRELVIVSRSRGPSGSQRSPRPVRRAGASACLSGPAASRLIPNPAELRARVQLQLASHGVNGVNGVEFPPSYRISKYSRVHQKHDAEDAEMKREDAEGRSPLRVLIFVSFLVHWDLIAGRHSVIPKEAPA